jgi:tetratricopeptide (TPR) repeat protein
MRTACLLAILFVHPAFPVVAQEAPISKGFDHFYNLEYDDAIREFRKLCTANPSDPNPYNHVAQAILYREMFNGGALESELVSGSNPFLRRPKMNTSEEGAREFDQSIAKAMELANARLSANSSDVKGLYALGVSYGLLANYNFLVKKAWIEALRDATAARKLHNRISDIDPNFVDARLVQGAHDYLVGSLPFRYKVLGFLAGIHGDRDTGIKILHTVADKGSMNKYDAQVILAAIYRREREPDHAVPLLNNLIAKFPRNYLLRFEMAQMYGDLGDKTQALAAIQKVEELKKAGAPGYTSLPLEKIHYYRGNLLFWQRDLDQALQEMKQVAPKASSLDLATGSMSWLRIGQIHDMQGHRKEAVDAYKHAIAVAPNSEAAKESKEHLTSPYRRPA